MKAFVQKCLNALMHWFSAFNVALDWLFIAVFYVNLIYLGLESLAGLVWSKMTCKNESNLHKSQLESTAEMELTSRIRHWTVLEALKISLAIGSNESMSKSSNSISCDLASKNSQAIFTSFQFQSKKEKQFNYLS